VTHLAAAVFFTFALLTAAVAIHMTVRAYWAEILLALKGEWAGTQTVRRPAAARSKPLPALAVRPGRAAF
jgi:hypothetical protein